MKKYKYAVLILVAFLIFFLLFTKSEKGEKKKKCSGVCNCAKNKENQQQQVEGVYMPLMNDPPYADTKPNQEYYSNY